jgi:nitrite reductase/ring-hydroxylating ferredoxin subunit
MPDVRVGEAADFGDPGRRVVEVEGIEVGVFRLGQDFYAYENRCPHLDGPVCQGKILPLALEAVASDGTSSGRVFSTTRMNVICPWHGFEFDIRTGAHPTNPKVRLRRIPVQVIDGEIYVTVRGAAQRGTGS